MRSWLVKKRSADEITEAPPEYSDINKSLAELYHERKKVRMTKAQDSQDQASIKQSIKIDIKDEELNTNNEQKSQTIKEFPDPVQKQESKAFEFKEITGKEIVKSSAFLVSFREMMYPDLLKGGVPKRDLEIAFMTTFGSRWQMNGIKSQNLVLKKALRI